MDRLPLIRNKQKTIGILDVVLAVIYLGIIGVLIATMFAAFNINTDANGDGTSDAGEAIGGIFLALGAALVVVFLVFEAIIYFIGFIFWIVSGSMQLSASKGKKDVKIGFNTFIIVIQIISFIILAIAGIIDLASIKGSNNVALNVCGMLVNIAGAVLCLVSAIFKIKLNALMKVQEQKEAVEEMQHTAEHRADINVFENESDE